MKLTSEELKVPLDLVDDLTSFYWKRVHKAMSGLEGAEIQVAGLGTFKVKNWKLDEKLLKYKGFMDRIDTVSFRKYEIYKSLEDRVSLLTNLKEYFAQEKLRKKEIKCGVK
jgi:hypothetical protein